MKPDNNTLQKYPKHRGINFESLRLQSKFTLHQVKENFSVGYSFIKWSFSHDKSEL